MVRLDSLEGRLGMAFVGVSVMPATIREPVPQLCVAEATRFCAEAVLRSAESQLQVFCASESSLEEEFDQLKSERPIWRTSGSKRLRSVGIHVI